MIRFAQKPIAPCIKPVMRSIAERMASDMNEMAFAGYNVSEQTLRERGYTAPVIKRIAPEAAQIARRTAIRQIASV